MPDHYFWLSDAQFARLQPLLPSKVRGVPRVDDRKVISGIIHVIRYGLMWRDAPTCYGPHKTKGALSRCIGRTRGGLNSKLHAVCDGDGKPLILVLTAGQVSGYLGADTVLPALPEADVMIADRGYDNNRLRKALTERNIKPCIPGRANRKEPIVYDTELYKSRNLIERLFGRLKDWRRIATRYDRCAHTFYSAICIAATVIFWL